MLWVKRIALALTGLIAIMSVTATWLTLRSLPQTDGSVVVSGLSADTEIRRDTRGVPTIRAHNEGDAFFALGYVHAQDRLFQMELMRRLGAGRLAEVLGSNALESDKFMRTLGLYRHAEANAEVLDPATREAIEHYAAGINSWLETRERPLPPEFQLLNLTPEPWRIADSLVWQKLMSLSLAGNWRDELLRSRLLKVLPPNRVAQLWPDLEPDAPTTLAGIQSLVPGTIAERLTNQIDAHAPPTLASNVWVIDGQHTASGKPLLASDPHLGFQAPIIWYLARMEWPGGELTGATAPGVPFTVIGHNGFVGWGMTTTHADLQDLFIERVTSDGRYETPSGPQDFGQRTETIDVRFGDPVSLKVRSTRHGPVVSDLGAFRGFDTNEETSLALAATMLRDDDATADAIYQVGHSQTVDEVKQALSGFEGPQQNFMYADIQGGIGFSSPALVPMRKSGDGSVPVPGWSGAYDWQGWVPYEELPHSVNPETGRLVNANNRPVPPDYPHLIAATFPEGYRAERIDKLLDELAPASATAQDMVDIQVDALSTMPGDLLPVLLPLIEDPADSTQSAIALLSAWDGAMDRDRPEPLIFLTWLDVLKEELLSDELGPAYAGFRGDHPILIRTILTEDPSWCSGAHTSCSAAVTHALERALDWLVDQTGTSLENIADLRWGEFHRARFGHPVFDLLPGLSKLTTLEIETDGSDHTVNRGGFRGARGRAPFRHSHGAGLRAVFDFNDLSQSLFITATGQSGHPASPHYSDLLMPWRDGATFTLSKSDDVNAVSTLTLKAGQN